MFDLRKAMKVCLAIKSWRIDDLATNMNKPKRTLESSLYNGNPTLNTLSNIAKEFGIPLSEFIKRGEQE